MTTCKIWINCIEQIYLKVLTVEIETVWAILSPECNKALVDWGEKASGEGGCLVHKGNVEQHPNAAMNRWIMAILIFDFKLVHVPRTKYKGPDRLSRRRVTEGKEEGEGAKEAENWVDKIISCGVL